MRHVGTKAEYSSWPAYVTVRNVRHVEFEAGKISCPSDACMNLFLRSFDLLFTQGASANPV